MRDELLSYYERELTFLRQMGVEFAEKYPKIASRLLLEPSQCDDPHVERLLEAFAFLAARVHLKIDDEFPEITEALLSIVYPHFIRPIPAMTVVEFHGEPEKGGVSTPVAIPRGAVLNSRPIDGMPCKFRVAFDTVMQPLMIRDVQWRTPDRLNPPVRVSGSAAALRVEFKCGPDVKLDKLGLKSLRLYLNAESHLVHSAYEIICCNTMQILVRDSNPNSRKKPIILLPESIRPVGFHEDEAVIPYPRRSFFGYRFLQEYFTFPEKYFFVDITNLEPLATSGFQEGFEFVFIFSPFELPDRQQQLEVGMAPKSVRINCAPIINLFPQTCEPILLTQTKPEYPIVPDVRRPNALEVFSVDEVFSSNPQTAEITNYAPFYSYRHGTIRDKLQTFWHATRRQSTRRNDEGTEVYLQLVDLSGRPMRPDFDAVTVRATCTNRDLPARLPFGNEQGDFEMEGFAQVRRVVALRKPTMTIRPPVGKGALWRLISHLSLNYLSLVSEGKESLQEILRLYEFSSSPYLQKQVAGITQLQSKRHFARIISENGIAFARGMLVRIEFDEEQFVGGGVYLFASVLEHFLGHYASMNSFSQLVASSRQRKEVLREWPPRAGQQILI